MKVLHLKSSILGDQSASRQISERVIDRLRAGNASIDLVERDLVANPLPHMELAILPNRHPGVARASEQARATGAEERAVSDRVLDQFLEADTVVIGAPMYNFTLPSQLKAWIDRIVVPGVTFRYGENGPEGLMGDKRVILVPTSGNVYGVGSPESAEEHVVSYLRALFRFIGVTNLEMVSADGLNLGPDKRVASIARAASAASELRAA